MLYCCIHMDYDYVDHVAILEGPNGLDINKIADDFRKMLDKRMKKEERKAIREKYGVHFPFLKFLELEHGCVIKESRWTTY